MSFKFGIEHEVAFQRLDGTFADFTNTQFEDFQKIIDALPEYVHDDVTLRMGDAGIRRKRWYIEGFERFNEQGELLTCVPKGIEIRTTIHHNIAATLAELQQSYELLVQTAQCFGYQPCVVSYNPVHSQFVPQPPLNAYELAEQMQALPEESETVYIPMVTYGPDLSVSHSTLTDSALVDIAQKLTWYSPFIVPFSFVQPSANQHQWQGLSLRTWTRTGIRPAVLAFITDEQQHIAVKPTLTKMPRHPAEAGRLEFKAFDTCNDFQRYAALFALLKGLVLDQSLSERAIKPDLVNHQVAALQGFNSPYIKKQAMRALTAARHALQQDPDCQYLEFLQIQLEH